ncbi:type III restriction endonuclease subunit R [Leptospira fluminis]|uniref:Type III restriction endonuclease subunit R n=1 Tax=Leptospira fluminis TaxID=2484979 RepID=A0A4R9GLN1_9LEPT|nr:DEAD/DEAH box helicase family protein [Leptospira fluminis]TGK15724.1 type III restriction endonuclease subunit R [Leptospira fluminis]
MVDKYVNSITGRLSLRAPQHKSLDILSRIMDIGQLSKSPDLEMLLSAIHSEYPSVTDFEREFPSLCFALATGVGKTRLMGAFIAYLHLSKLYKNFFILAPNLTIYKKLIADFTPNTAKYVFKGISEFSINPPEIITGENYESGKGIRNTIFETGIHINIFNISKINSEVRGGKSPKIKRLSEYIGESYFEYLAGLSDLVLLMDESHRYRASAGIKAINELRPILGLELTATPRIEIARASVPFKNVIFEYSLSKALEDGFVKEPVVVTQKNFDASQLNATQVERIKLEDGIRLHENTKVELRTYALQSNQTLVKPFVLVIARDTSHADDLQKFIESESFFGGGYKGKTIQIHSGQQGEEKEEVVERLLAVERNDEPTEIVIHVNMLKEGWDVTNLYTIIPLRAANARILVEQSIGRGLRLPYGKKTGIAAVDRLNIIAHDRFQEIVDEANRSDSLIRLKTLILDPDADLERGETVVIKSGLSLVFSGAEQTESSKSELPVRKLFENEESNRAASVVYDVIRKYENLPTSRELLKTEVQEKIAMEVGDILRTESYELPGITVAVNIKAITRKVAEVVVDRTIDIPRIQIVPKNGKGIKYKFFRLDCSSIHLQLVDRDVLIHTLHSNQEETISFNNKNLLEGRMEDYLVRGLIDFDDISYADHSDLLYDLCSQLIRHFRTYLKSEEEIYNVIVFHQKQLVDFIYVQMQIHQIEEDTEYEVIVSKGFSSKLKEIAASVSSSEAVDYRKADFDKLKIGRILFGGFEKCLFPQAKFSSDTERRFAAILERESIKWFRPAKGQFQIFYTQEGFDQEYIPDFVAECDSVILMIETKAKNEINLHEVTLKKNAAVKWCEIASNHSKEYSGKPWKYLLIPHNEVRDNMSLEYYIKNS